MLATDILVLALFAASLQFVMGTGGMASFGHAAYFGLGAYAAALAVKHGMPMEGALALAPLVAMAGALVFGWFCVRLSGVYLAMLTLAFAQIVWSIAFQWDAVTGGSNGVVGVWPPAWLAEQGAPTTGSRSRSSARRSRRSPGSRTRRSATRCARAAIRRCAPRRSASTCGGRNGWPSRSPAAFAGLAGGLYAFSKGSISPETLAIPRSVDALVMVLLGGLNALAGPAARRRGVHLARRHARARRPSTGARCSAPRSCVIVLAFPMGIGGALAAPACATESRDDAPPTVLAVDGLAKSFGGVDAVRDVSFAVAAGELVALIGPNGAGKTTCFNLINGQLAPDAGDGDARRRAHRRPAAARRSRAWAWAARSRSRRRSRR